MILFAAAAAASLTPGVAADLRCFAALASTVAQVPEPQRAGVIGGIMYFVGRIDAAAPGLDYRAELAALVASDPEARTITAELPRCTAVMKEKGQSLIAMGNALKAAAAR